MMNIDKSAWLPLIINNVLIRRLSIINVQNFGGIFDPVPPLCPNFIYALLLKTESRGPLPPPMPKKMLLL